MAIGRTGTAVTDDITGEFGSGTLALTVPNPCAAIVVMWHYNDDNGGGDTFTSFTLDDGVEDFTIHQNLASTAGGANAVGVATLGSPSTGSQTLTYAYSNSTLLAYGGGFGVTYVIDTDVTGTTVNIRHSNAVRNEGATDTSIGVTSVTGDLVLSSCSSDGTPVISGSTTYLDNVAFVGGSGTNTQDHAEQTTVNGTTTTTMTGENYSAMVSISLKPAAGGGGGGGIIGTGALSLLGTG